MALRRPHRDDARGPLDLMKISLLIPTFSKAFVLAFQSPTFGEKNGKEKRAGY